MIRSTATAQGKLPCTLLLLHGSSLVAAYDVVDMLPPVRTPNGATSCTAWSGQRR